MAKNQRIFNYPSIDLAIERVIQQKKIYADNLVDKSFLYLYIDKANEISYKEVQFKEYNYLHLTGLDYQSIQYEKRVNGRDLPTDAQKFYERLGNDDTIKDDISFIVGATSDETNRYYAYTQHKLDNLSQLTAISNKAEYIGEAKSDDFDIVINRNKSSIAFNLRDSIYYPISSMFGAAKDVATNVYPIAAILSKSKGQQDFQLEYLNADVKMDKAYFERSLIDKLSQSSFENPNIKFNIGKLEEIKRTFQLSEAKYISQDLSEISQLRKVAFENEEALNAYICKCKVFRNGLDTERKADTAADILKKQLENETDSEVKKLINEELNELKYQQSMSAAAPYVMKCEFKPLPENISHEGAAVITAEPTLHNNSGAATADIPALNPFKNLIDRLKNIFKKQDKPPAVQADEQSESIKNESIEEDIVPSKFDELIKAREAFAEEKITFKEYQQALANYIYSFTGKEMWTEAVDTLRNQLKECPDKLKKSINYEIDIIERNFKKRFAPKPPPRQQTLDEIKSAAHEQYVKLQSENKATEKEITTVKSKSER